MFVVKFIWEHMDANMAQEVNMSIKIDVLTFFQSIKFSGYVLTHLNTVKIRLLLIL